MGLAEQANMKEGFAGSWNDNWNVLTYCHGGNLLCVSINLNPDW